MKKLMQVGSSVVLLLAAIHNAQALGLGDVAGAAGALQKDTQTAPSTTSTGLTGLLMQQLGVSQPQAEGGAGAIFQMAKSKMQTAAFSKLSSSVPGMSSLLSAAPAAQPAVGGTGLGGLASIAGAAAGGSTGNLLGLAGSFQQLGLAPDMVQKFVPVVMQYVQGTGGGAVASTLQAALMGGS